MSKYWVNDAADNDWHNGLNWSTELNGVGGSGVPQFDEDVYVSESGGAPCYLTADAECNRLLGQESPLYVGANNLVCYDYLLVDTVNGFDGLIDVSDSGSVTVGGAMYIRRAGDLSFASGSALIMNNNTGNVQLISPISYRDITIYGDFIIAEGTRVRMDIPSRSSLAISVHGNFTVGLSGQFGIDARYNDFSTFGSVDIYGTVYSYSTASPWKIWSDGTKNLIMHPSGYCAANVNFYATADTDKLSSGIWGERFYAYIYDGMTWTMPEYLIFNDNISINTTNGRFGIFSAVDESGVVDGTTNNTHITVGEDLYVRPAAGSVSGTLTTYLDGVTIEFAGEEIQIIDTDPIHNLGNLISNKTGGTIWAYSDFTCENFVGNSGNLNLGDYTMTVNNELLVNGMSSIHSGICVVGGNTLLYGTPTNTLYIKDTNFQFDSPSLGYAKYCYADQSTYTGDIFMDATHHSNVGYNVPISGWHFCDLYWPLETPVGKFFFRKVHDHA